MHSLRVLVAIWMALASVVAAKCTVEAGMTTFPGNTGWLHVKDSTGKKIAQDASLLCYSDIPFKGKELKEGTQIAEDNRITIPATAKSGLAHDVSVQVTCDGQFIDTCAFEYGDTKLGNAPGVKRYARGTCEMEFDC